MQSFKTFISISIITLSFISISANANARPDKYFLIAPHCLIKNIPAGTSYKILSESTSLSFMETNNLEAVITAKKVRTTSPCGGFIDVTEKWQQQHQSAKTFLKNHELPAQKSQPLSAEKYSIRYPDQVNQLLSQLNSNQIWADLTAFSDTHSEQFPDRHPNSAAGVKAAEWLQNKIIAIANENDRDDVTVYTVATGKRYKQPSVVVKIGNSNAGGIVIGGHMDTLTSIPNVKPGADDDGSGSMTVMGVARTLLASGMRFKKPIYIIWYAAEEEGLVGSSFVVQDFVNKKIPVDAVIQFDMTGYAHKSDPTLWLMTDYVNPDLTTFLATLVKTYVAKPVRTSKCGYACSDHASWTAAKIKSAFPFEASFGNDNPNIHQSTDTIDRLSLSHIADFTKLGVAFAVELAEPVE
jgi:leucyl aminopeptidase